MSDDTPEVTAERPDSAFRVTGTDHITLIGSNEEDTIEFYRDMLGMPLVLRQPNLDDPNSTHLFFDTGDGRILTFFVQEDRQSNPQPHRHRVGSVHHLSFSIDAEDFVDIKESLEEAGHGFNEFDRGIFHSLYTRDHNGLTIELSADKFDVPDDRRGEVLATAQKLRVEDGSEFAEERHLEAALEELGIDAEKYELPDADSGVGGV
ncbi:VOC family protein [Natronoarchaeum mannanilyticum]|uniref:VOC family protein n=1 Tax=Natronoarchaeum mannanilyticum TaxID=926360 RepID=A0AAV3T944_9EURY